MSRTSLTRTAPSERIARARVACGLRALRTLNALRALREDRGAATAEYAVVIMAAVAFATVLVGIVRSGQVQAMLTDLVQKALTVG